MQTPNESTDLYRWPAAGRPAEYFSLKVRSILRQQSDAGAPWYWSLNPYEGCEFACTFCQARLEKKDFASWRGFEKKVGVKANAVEALMKDLRAEDFQGRQVVLGTSTEPWQQAEEHSRVTRALLTALTKIDGLDLRVNTRSSLIARDGDLLKQIATKGRVTIAFSLASLDERVNRLMEPRAPSVFRRLAALESLARLGLNVGLIVSPVFAGLDEDELGLEALLTRAANAGARFAGMKVMQFGPGQREVFLEHVTTGYPEMASRFRRIIGRRTHTAEEERTLKETFSRLCSQVGLLPLEEAAEPRAPEPAAPAQLGLFS
jgi:DNA repair photolyase